MIVTITQEHLERAVKAVKNDLSVSLTEKCILAQAIREQVPTASVGLADARRRIYSVMTYRATYDIPEGECANEVATAFDAAYHNQTYPGLMETSRLDEVSKLLPCTLTIPDASVRE